MSSSPDAGHAYKFLQSLASDLSTRQITFPTFTGATIRVRSALGDPNIDADRLAHVISAEPLLPARLIQIANSAAMNPGGKPVADVRAALLRVGHDVVRSTAVTLALEQLKAAKDVQSFHARAEWTWRHSLEVAAIAYVLAKKTSKINADEALFAGLVHDIGAFYLLSRAAGYPEIAGDPAELDAVIQEWHSSIGQAVLHEFRLSDGTLRAVSDHEDHKPVYPVRSLLDIVTFANRIALQANPPKYPGHVDRSYPPVDTPEVLQVANSSADEIRTLLNALHG
jgi:putative nucleotidyltransferase with HDIG domain